MANSLREQASTMLKYLNDPSALHQKRTWYRNGKGGNLHSDTGCYKLDSWRKVSTSLSTAEAANKKNCSYCTPRSLFNYQRETYSASQASRMHVALAKAANCLDTPTMPSIGDALMHYEEFTQILSDLDEEHRKLVSKALKRLEKKRVSFVELLDRVKSSVMVDAPSWAAAALARSKVSDVETDVPGANLGDLCLYGDNTDDTEEYNYMLPHLYMRWHHHRPHGAEAATASTLELLEKASLTSVEQMHFKVLPPENEVFLESWVLDAWRKETRNRLVHNLIPLWEKQYLKISGQTATKLVGIGCVGLRSSAGRALVYPYPVHRNNSTVLALVPEVVGNYLLIAEKTWRNDVVEMTDPCSVDALDIIAALWDPHKERVPSGEKSSGFTELSAAAAAGSRL